MMQASKNYIPPTTQEEKILQRKVADMVKTVCHSGVPKFTGFLSLREQELALAEINRQRWADYSFYGGYDNAERVLLAVYDVVQPEPPITAIDVAASAPPRQEINLTHRDYLGAVLATGIKRECVGDIVVKGSSCGTIFLLTKMVPYLLQEFTSACRYAVSLEIASAFEPPAYVTPKEEKTASVASLRLDAVLAAMLHKSRNEAASMIQKELVQINHLLVSSLHYQVCEGDVFSIKGIGKYKLSKIGGYSKKNRVFIEFLKY